MSANKTNNQDYHSLKSPFGKGGTDNGDQSALKSLHKPAARNHEDSSLKNLRRSNEVINKSEISPEKVSVGTLAVPTDNFVIERQITEHRKVKVEEKTNYAATPKQRKQEKKAEKDRQLLSNDRWLLRNGHSLTYVGTFLFTLVLYFRPYELFPALSALSSIAFILAIATLLIYLPTQLSSEGSLTILSTEVKCILFITFWALVTMPLAKSPGMAWETFNDTFNKVVLMFIVMVNTLRTPARLKGLMWLSIAVGVMLSFQAVELYRAGNFAVEGYRVSVQYRRNVRQPERFGDAPGDCHTAGFCARNGGKKNAVAYLIFRHDDIAGYRQYGHAVARRISGANCSGGSPCLETG